MPDGCRRVERRVGPHNLFVEGYEPVRDTRRPSILCIGGAFDGSWIYGRFLWAAAEAGFAAYALNQRGYYKSEWQDVAALGMGDYLEDVRAARDALGLKNCVLVGYSVGGLYAQLAAARDGARAVVLYDSSPTREVADELGIRPSVDFVDRIGNVPPVLAFQPDRKIVEEMRGRAVSPAELHRQQELFRQSRLSGRAFRELEIDRPSVGRVSAPTLLLGISARNRAHRWQYERADSNWYVFEGYSHGSLLYSMEADHISHSVLRWLKLDCPVGRREVYRLAPAANGARAITLIGQGLRMKLRYYSGWLHPEIRVQAPHADYVRTPRRVGPGRTPREHLYEADLDLDAKAGFLIAQGGALDRPAANAKSVENGKSISDALYRPALKECWLVDGQFRGHALHGVPHPPVYHNLLIHSRALNHDFDVKIRLPAGYNPHHAYPVAVLNDGQNQWRGEGMYGGWHTDTIAEDSMRRGKLRDIVLVAVVCHRYRNRAYLPPPTAKAHLYADFLCDEVLPSLRKKYSLSGRPEDQAIIGSSYGATNAVYTALKRPDVFGLVGSLSFAYVKGNPQIHRIEEMREAPFFRIYIDCGTRWSEDQPHRDDYTNLTRRLMALCSSKGMVHGRDLLGVVCEGHLHNEYYWRQRIGGCLRFLFRAD